MVDVNIFVMIAALVIGAVAGVFIVNCFKSKDKDSALHNDVRHTVPKSMQKKRK